MRATATLIFACLPILQLAGANIDTHFSVDPDDVQLREISDTVRRVSGAVMGLTEYVMDIRSELRTIRSDIFIARSANVTPPIFTNSTTSRPLSYYSGKPIKDPVEVRKQSLVLADKVEKLLAMDQSPQVDLAKEELKRTVEKNFLRMLAAILVTGPMHTQERSDDIFKLMRSVLNGELDFTPVVQRLPLILRDSETNQFVNLLITLRESEKGNGGSKSFREGLSSAENTSEVQGSSRQYVNFPIPNSPVGNAPINRPLPINPARPIYNPNNRPYIPPNNNRYQGNLNYQGSLLQQANNNNNFNNRIPGNANNLNNNNNINNNNNVNPNPNGQQTGTGGDATQGAAGQGNNGQLPNINSLIEAMSQTQQLFKELPNLIEGMQTLVESLEGLIG